jgi:hypothetical protein
MRAVPRPRYKEGEEPEFVPDAWARFERAVKAMAKAKPIHRAQRSSKTKSRKKKAG